MGETPLASPQSSQAGGGASVTGSIRSSLRGGSKVGSTNRSRKRKATDEWDELTPIGSADRRDYEPSQGSTNGDGAKYQKQEENKNIEAMRLDDFFRQYTSEDNAALEELLEKVEKEHRRKFWWAYERADEGARQKQLTDGTVTGRALEALQQQRLEDQKKQRGEITYEKDKPALLNTWNHRVVNHLHNVPDLDDTRDVCALPPSNEQKRLNTGQIPKMIEDSSEGQLAVKDCNSQSTALVPSETINRDGGVSKPKVLSYKSTRFDENFLSSQRSKVELAIANQTEDKDKDDGKNPAAPSHALEKPHVGGQETLELDPDQSKIVGDFKGVNGYSFVATPSPMPGGGDGEGVNQTPQVTWGRIDGTPLVLGDHQSNPTEDGDSDDEDVDIEKWLEENLLKYKDYDQNDSRFQAASSFKMNAPSKRDEQGRILADKAKIDRRKLYNSSQNRTRPSSSDKPSSTALDVARSRRDSVSSRDSDRQHGKVSGYSSARKISSATPTDRIASLSPAAQTLAKRMGVRQSTPLSKSGTRRGYASKDGPTPIP